MRYKMIVLDLDGTLTNSQKEITPYTKQMLFRYMEEGGTVVLASGRPTYGIVPLAKELELPQRGGYILSYNGGNIFDCKTMEAIYQKKMDPKVPAKLAAMAKEYNVALLTYQDEFLITETPDDEYVRKEEFINKMPPKKVDDFAAYVDFPITKCLMTADGDYLAQVEKWVKERLGHENNVFRSAPFFLEIVPKGIDKAQSLGRLLAYLGMSVEEMAAFGDGFNDKSMIEYAGLGVAMSNAVDEVKEVARLIAPSNDEDGVGWTIEKVILADLY